VAERRLGAGVIELVLVGILVSLRRKSESRGGTMESGAEGEVRGSYTVHPGGLSGTEADVMHVVRGRRSATARDVYEALSETQQIAFTTVMGALRSLAAKGLVDQDWRATARSYAAPPRNVALARSLVNEVVAELLAGDAEPVLGYLEQRRFEVERTA
jgi:predicted transcriptional regulator